MVEILANVQVGDKLCITQLPGSSKQIVAIEKITPSGRVITKAGIFLPNGNMYGDSNKWSRSYARKAAPDDIAEVYNRTLLAQIERFRRWDKLSPDDITAVITVINKYDKS